MFPVSRLKLRRKLIFSFLRGLTELKEMRILNVAEKNDAARNIAALLSRGTAIKRESLSVFNKIYEFECEVLGQKSKMIMTSVSGHLMTMDFPPEYRSWAKTDPDTLFDAPVTDIIIPEHNNVKKSLEKEIRTCSKLIIWTDCDREGEGIGFEIINVCKLIKRNLEIYRARFSDISFPSVQRALNNLVDPDKHTSDAVQVRKELDLRIGAAFTRLQTNFLGKAFPKTLNEIVSYGSCQFPTLGFVVERFKAISEFKSEKFWVIKVQHTIKDLSVNFHWKRNRLFEKLPCEILYDKCAESETAKVEDVKSKPHLKFRPKPLDTVTLQKSASIKFGIGAKEALDIAENLYRKGFISYPRTETNFFSKDINLDQVVQLQTEDPNWGGFAQKVLKDGPNPFQGKNTDAAHSPIYPIKYTNELRGKERKVYEFIVRHFLACLSKHAEGLETTVEIDVAGEKFSTKGLIITAKNYLEVYPYEKWSDKEIHTYQKDDIFKPELSMVEEETSPPRLLTEANLIELMEKHGIGTDSTHATHIETIKARMYVGLQDGKYFVPRTLGMGLVEGYNNMGYGMAKPELRAELEADLKSICNKEKLPADVLAKHIGKYRGIFKDVKEKMKFLSEAIQRYIEDKPSESSSHEKSPPPKFPLSELPPSCDCGKPAVSLTVQKPGPTLGNKFYSCGAVGSSNKCNFFQWGEKKSRKKVDNSRNEESENGNIRCYCSIPCRRVSTRKEGPNKGKVFFTCGKPKDDPQNCNFFQWADNAGNLNSRTNNRKPGPKGKALIFGKDHQVVENKAWTLWQFRS